MADSEFERRKVYVVVEYVDVKLVCVGAFKSKKDKLIPAFRELLPDGTLSEDRLAWDGVKASAGVVYDVKAVVPWDPDNRKINVNMRAADLWENKQDTVKWKAEYEAVRAEVGRKKAEAKLGREAKDVLAALREEYHDTPYPMRSAFLAAVISEITRGVV